MLAASLPVSRFLMSVSQFILIGNWLLIGENPLKKIQAFLKNKPALIFSSIYLFHLLGLIYTTDFNYAFNDLRIKLPLLILPLIFSSSPALNSKKILSILFAFIFGVLISTFISVYIYLTKDIVDIREISILINHITLSLMIVFAIFILLYFIFGNIYFKKSYKIFFFLMICWLIIFILLLESLTGITTLLGTLFIYAIYSAISTFKKNKFQNKLIILFLIIIIPASAIFYIFSINKKMDERHSVNFSTLDKYTQSGNKYYHDTLNRQTENGYYVSIYISPEELEKSWNSRSKINYHGKDRKGQNIDGTIIRFLTSKGLRKDSISMTKLTDKEINLIEKGTPNYLYTDNFNIRSKIEQIIWSMRFYIEDNNPNGNTLTQRIAYWHASFEIIKKNILIGVGEGDIDVSFHNYYKETNTQLLPQYWLRSHNQFLALIVSFGMLGFIWFLIGIFYPPHKLKMFSNYFFLIFLILSAISFLSDDSLESQAGVTFFTFFYIFLLLFGDKIQFSQAETKV